MAVDRVATFRTFIAKKPDDPFPRYGLAMELRTRGDLEGAAAAFDELIGLFPDYVPSYLMSGGVLAELGRRDDALARYQRGIEVATTKGDHHAKGELESAFHAAQDAADNI
ncbi:MAG TPA: tetratricopeptide repeat protein [Kofleriaceae bacterium]|nr:tetratricopeptide repeat protein [Kofleriaceae bacterium]